MDRSFQTVLALFFMLSANGCSFVFVDGPPRVPNEEYGQLTYFRCTEYTTVPIIDAAWGGLYAVTIVSTVVDHELSGEAAANAIGVALLMAGAYGASSYVGFRRVAECRAAKELWVEQRCPPDSGSVIELRSSWLPAR